MAPQTRQQQKRQREHQEETLKKLAKSQALEEDREHMIMMMGIQTKRICDLRKQLREMEEKAKAEREYSIILYEQLQEERKQ